MDSMIRINMTIINLWLETADLQKPDAHSLP
jgi:hypothetical protein